MSVLESGMFLEFLTELRDKCYQNSKNKGFWDEGEKELTEYDDDNNYPDQGKSVTVKTKPWNFGEKISLIHSELSEMFEAWRKNVKDSEKDITVVVYNICRRMTAIEEEVADVFIRMLDLCGKLDIDVGRVILAKMKYNEGRAHMHGGRKC